MAVTVAQVGTLPYYVDGHQKRTVTDVSFDASYPTGGEAVTAANLRLNSIDYAEAQIQTTATTTVNSASVGFVVDTGSAGGVLKVFDETPAEVANTSNLSGLVARVTAYGS